MQDFKVIAKKSSAIYMPKSASERMEVKKFQAIQKLGNNNTVEMISLQHLTSYLSIIKTCLSGKSVRKESHLSLQLSNIFRTNY